MKKLLPIKTASNKVLLPVVVLLLVAALVSHTVPASLQPSEADLATGTEMITKTHVRIAGPDATRHGEVGVFESDSAEDHLLISTKADRTEAGYDSQVSSELGDESQIEDPDFDLTKAYVTEAGFEDAPSLRGASQDADSETPASGGEMVRILVKAKAHMTEAALHAQLSLQGLTQQIDPVSPALDVRVIEVPAEDVDSVLLALQENEDLEYAEPDLVAHTLGRTNDTHFDQQWCLSKIHASEAWDIVKGSSDVVVAVLDTGVLTSHPDLKRSRVLKGYNFVSNNRNTTDDNGHGTAVAGLIAASNNNGSGMAALTYTNRILPVKVLDSEGSGSYSNIARGIVWATDNGARIINLSLGGTSSSSTLQQAVNYAWKRNVIVIAAAGNNGDETRIYPAACRNVVAVSATDSSDRRPDWSSYGRYVDVSAPGDGVLSLYGPDGYAYWSGTSFSSPVTSGVVALMVSANSSLSNEDIVRALRKSSEDIGPKGFDKHFGHGRVNACRAVETVAADFASDTKAPVARISSSTDGARLSGKVANGARLSGSVVVSVLGKDNVGTTRVEFYVGGVLKGESDSASASFVWDTTNHRDGGPYTLEARAYDGANNVGVSKIKVSIKNSKVKDKAAPSAVITSQENGQLLKGRTARIFVDPRDNVAVKKVELYLDGKLVGARNPSRTKSNLVSFSLKTSKVAKGAHTLQAYAFDAAGNIGSSHRVIVYK